MPRYYLGVDWGDQTHGGCARDEEGTIVWEGTVPHTVVGLSEWGRRLDEWRPQYPMPHPKHNTTALLSP